MISTQELCLVDSLSPIYGITAEGRRFIVLPMLGAQGEIIDTVIIDAEELDRAAFRLVEWASQHAKERTMNDGQPVAEPGTAGPDQSPPEHVVGSETASQVEQDTLILDSPTRRQLVTSAHETDPDGCPAGGLAVGCGIEIHWQCGPVPRQPSGEWGQINGAFVEGVIECVLDRLRFYQTAKAGRYACRQNSLAITKLEEAIHWLEDRQFDRAERGVLGTQEP